MYNKYIFINNNRRKKANANEKTKSMEENANVKTTKAISKGKEIKFVDDYVLVDIETTGLSPVSDDIIEIGAIKVKNNEIIDTYNELIKVDKKLTTFITNLTGITDEMLKNGKLPEMVLQEFIGFVGEDTIMGHNVNFDLGFLRNKCMKYLDIKIQNPYIDTMYLARKLVPDSPNYKLGTLADYFNISYKGAHRGLRDVEITYSLYNELKKLNK